MRPPPRTTVTCERCAATSPYDRDALQAAGWLEMARAGRKVEARPWLCPEHNATLTPPSTKMRTTP